MDISDGSKLSVTNNDRGLTLHAELDSGYAVTARFERHDPEKGDLSIEDVAIREPSVDFEHGSWPSRYVITPIYGHGAIACADYRGKRVNEISPGAHAAISEAACVIDDSEFGDLVGDLIHDLEGLTGGQGFVIEHVPSLSAGRHGSELVNRPNSRRPEMERGRGQEIESSCPPPQR